MLLIVLKRTEPRARRRTGEQTRASSVAEEKSRQADLSLRFRRFGVPPAAAGGFSVAPLTKVLARIDISPKQFTVGCNADKTNGFLMQDEGKTEMANKKRHKSANNSKGVKEKSNKTRYEPVQHWRRKHN